MFGLFDSPEKKMRDSAASWLEVAAKVWSYRRDALTPAESGELAARTGELKRLVSERAGPEQLKQGIEDLQATLTLAGGAIYPKTSLVENVEFFLVAAIVIIGIRTYFVQPFKIPTNSMWPTYYGMTAENLPPGAKVPNAAERLFRLLAFGAQRKTVVAPRDGELTVPLFIRGDLVSVAYTIRPGRSWLVFPTKLKEYTFYVGGEPATVTVPLDFDDFDNIVFDTFFPDKAALRAQIERARQAGQTEEMRLRVYEERGDLYEAERVPFARTLHAGDPVVRFDLMAGDQLFVDRISYNFVRPTVGEGFVFRTDNIPDIFRAVGAEYYIKRLVGVPGDTIEIRDPVIYRNGAPITGSVAFDLNARKVSPYLGYGNASHDDPRFSLLFPGEPITVPESSFLALGDNSHNSSDGRYWGYVPGKDVVGRPLFIYYPFTRRFGTAK